MADRNLSGGMSELGDPHANGLIAADLRRVRAEEDAEYERKRGAMLRAAALDMLAEQYGQADWQRFRRERPIEWLNAKVAVDSGPPALRFCIEPYYLDRERNWQFSALWTGPNGTERIDVRVSWRELMLDSGDTFLRFVLSSMASPIERRTKVRTRFTIRGNRSAYEHAQKPAPAPTPQGPEVPQRYDAYLYCGECEAKFENIGEERFPGAQTLPCGHSSLELMMKRAPFLPGDSK